MEKAICKRSYPYAEGDYLYYHQLFLIGKTYNIVSKVQQSSELWYGIESEGGYNTELFSETEFHDYFITISEIRKEKLQKINKVFLSE